MTGHGGAGGGGGGSAVDRGREDFSLYFFFLSFYTLMLTSVPVSGRCALASAWSLSRARLSVSIA